MKLLATILLISSAAAATAVAAKEPPTSPNAQVASELKRTLQAMVNSQTTPPGQSARPVDPDQGDDNAALRAIQVVCSSDTPAADRSAICPTPISPD